MEGRKEKGGGFLGNRQAKFHAMLRIQGQQGTVRVYTVEQGGRKREGGVKSGNNSKQTQREKDREGEALQDKQNFYLGGEGILP